jgi:hypothetical protein
LIAAHDAFRTPDVAKANTLLVVQFESALNRGDVDGALAMFVDRAEGEDSPDPNVWEAQIRGRLEYLAANKLAAEPGLRRSCGDRVS